jgi:hypothetical protein
MRGGISHVQQNIFFGNRIYISIRFATCRRSKSDVASKGRKRDSGVETPITLSKNWNTKKGENTLTKNCN